ncbi:MAG: DUF6166 domain-containing protein [Alphaproteobacteria bacterium]|nr:DUF6166 domain-containing protein [Alphaproteobacteria bacterium]
MSADTDRRSDLPYYSVDILEADGQIGHWGCPASSVEDALAQAREAHPNRADRVQSAEFNKFHLENRLPGSNGKTYRGLLLVDGSRWVYAADEKDIVHGLKPRLDLANHSPDGFAWGYGGSGPAQLSLALLADALGDDERALRLYQPFKHAYIAGLRQDKAWEVSEDFIVIMAAHVEAQLRARCEAA